MNYPDLIWRLVELLLHKENSSSQEIDRIAKTNNQDVKQQNETN